jgi:hypothetical protein
MTLNENLTPEEQSLVDEIRKYLDDIVAAPDFKKVGFVDRVPQFYLKKALGEIGYLRANIKDPGDAERRLQQQQQRKAQMQSGKGDAAKLVAELKMPKLLTVTQSFVHFVQPSGDISDIPTDRFVKNATRIVEAIRAFTDRADYTALKEEMQWMDSVGFKASKLMSPNERTFELPVDGVVRGYLIDYSGPVLDFETISVVEAKEYSEYLLKITEYDRYGSVKKEDHKLDGWTHGHVEELIDTITPVQLAANHLKSFIERVENIGRDLIGYTIETNDAFMHKRLKVSIQSDEITGGARGVLQLLQQRLGESLRTNN